MIADTLPRLAADRWVAGGREDPYPAWSDELAAVRVERFGRPSAAARHADVRLAAPRQRRLGAVRVGTAAGSPSVLLGPPALARRRSVRWATVLVQARRLYMPRTRFGWPRRRR